MKLGDSPLKKQNNNVFAKASLPITLVVISFALIFIDLIGAFTPLYYAISFVGEPVQYYTVQVRDTVSDYVFIVSRLGKIRQDLSYLRTENAELKAQVADLEEAKREVEHLRKQLGIKELEPYELVEADIIGGDVYGVVSRFRINRGSQHGIQPGMAVVYEGILVGRIVEVSPRVSLVSFLTDPENIIVVMNARSRHRGVVHGSLEGVVMEDILQKEDLKVGDKIITSGDRLPIGLFVGTVQEIDSEVTSSQKSAKISPPVDYSLLEKVFVVKSYEYSDMNQEEGG